MPSTSSRATIGPALPNEQVREGESTLQRRHHTSTDVPGIATVENTTSTDVADLERSSSDDAERQSNADNRPGDPAQLAQDVAQMLDVGVSC